jgi:geranylgeranyl pyrophosphate synthase
MLSMEACAILDDTVDHTPCRSGRLSYPGRFGSASAAPFAGFLVSLVVEKTLATEPRVLPLVIDMFRDLCALETWEVGSRYPPLDDESMRHWLTCRYAEVTPAVVYGLDSALILQDAARLPPRVHSLFAEIFQDVDDLVNFAENREREGENDDLKMGMVTHLLLATLRAQPSITTVVTRMWDECRALRAGGDLTELARRSPRDRAAVVEAIAHHGVPATVAKIVADADACIHATPIPLRPMMEEMVLTFVDRLRRVEMLRDTLAVHVG